MIDPDLASPAAIAATAKRDREVLAKKDSPFAQTITAMFSELEFPEYKRIMEIKVLPYLGNLPQRERNRIRTEIRGKIKHESLLQFLSATNEVHSLQIPIEVFDQEVILRVKGNIPQNDLQETISDQEAEEQVTLQGKLYPFLNFTFPQRTNHLHDFATLDRLFHIYGEKYTIIKKLLWYQLWGIILREKKIKLGALYEDTRMHLLIALPSGKGKNDLKFASKKVVEKYRSSEHSTIRGVVAEPTSSHPEQFIGKMILRRKKVPTGEVTKAGKQKYAQTEEWIENKGSFDADLVQKDESYDLLASEEEPIRETRAYIRQAADPLGKNEVSKRQVDNLEIETLKYCPPCSFQFFFQPRQLPGERVEEGTMRRFFIAAVNLNFADRENVYSARVTEQSNSFEIDLENFTRYLREKHTLFEREQSSWDFTSTARQEVQQLHAALLLQGKMHSKKGFNYTFIMDTTLQNQLVKMACILAGSRGSLRVEVEDVQLAYLDHVEAFHHALEFITEKVDGYFDYGGSWRGAKGNEVRCLEWLYRHQENKGVTSAISVIKFKQKIAEIYECKLSTAESHYMRFRKKGWIESKQIGKDDSRVWLTFDLNEIKGDEGSEGDIPYSLINAQYDTLFSRFSSLLPYIPSLPLEEKVCDE